MENLKNLRMSNNLTQQSIANTLNINRSTYNGYEQGVSEPNIETLIKIADYFGCSIDYLVGHQTQGLISLEGASEEQQKLIKLVLTMNDKQASFSLGYLTDYMGLPASYARPTMPW